MKRRVATQVRSWMLWRWMEIGRGAQPYMTRLYVLQTPWFGVKFHRFHGPDPDPHCHDHPWWFLSLVLRGRYEEHRQVIGPDNRLTHEWMPTRHRWSLGFRRATDIHSIRYILPGTLTLVLNGPVTRGWGFWVPVDGERLTLHKFIPWKRYLGVSGVEEV